MTRILALLAALAFATPALADHFVALEQCMDEADVSGTHLLSCVGTFEGPCVNALPTPGYAEWAGCVSEEAQAWDVLLNENWRVLMDTLGAEDKARLRDAQRAWIAFRDADCEAVTLMAHPARGGLWGADCVRTRTAERVVALRSMTADRGQ